MEPTISCIIPVFNAAKYLADALDSVLAQTVVPNEIILIDDGSTDESAQVAARYHRHVRLVAQENLGPAAARNRGLRLANGELITFLDADDLWVTHKTARQREAFAQRPDLSICVTHAQNFWAPELQHEQAQADQRYTEPHTGYVCQCLMARREVFDKVGFFDESLRVSEDTDWFARAERAGVLKEVLPEVLVHRRLHSSNTSYAIYHSERARADLLEVAMRNLKHRRNSSRS